MWLDIIYSLCGNSNSIAYLCGEFLSKFDNLLFLLVNKFRVFFFYIASSMFSAWIGLSIPFSCSSFYSLSSCLSRDTRVIVWDILVLLLRLDVRIR